LNIAEGLGSENANGDLVFFRWVDGNTYIVADKVGGDGMAALTASTDSVVQLVGTYNSMSAAAGVVTLA
jgi:hypothetical protein